MVFHIQSTLMSDGRRELVRLHEADFPYAALDSALNLFSGRCSPWHWHDYFEFGLVQEGYVEFQTPHYKEMLNTGDAYFVNAGVLHSCRAAGDGTRVRLQVHQFDRSIVSSSVLVARRYVQPIENAADFEAKVFPVRNDAALADALRRAFTAAEEDDSGWEMTVGSALGDAWRVLYRVCADDLRSSGEESREDILRIKSMLSFIHSHYDQPVTVEEIARSAGICERECFRCFARVLDTTPKAYLTKYRVSAATRLLSETPLSITEIAYRCGFANSSYFGKVFHQMLGCTPRQFRK